MSVSKNIGDEIKNNINEDKNLYYKMNQINKDKLKRDDNERKKKKSFWVWCEFVNFTCFCYFKYV